MYPCYEVYPGNIDGQCSGASLVPFLLLSEGFPTALFMFLSRMVKTHRGDMARRGSPP